MGSNRQIFMEKQKSNVIKRPTWIRGDSCSSLIGSLQQERAGIIPYLLVDEKIYFCFGIDHDSKEYTDFGGIINDEDIDIADTALRCFRNETLAIFPINRMSLLEKDTLYIFDEKTLIIFVNLTSTKLTSPQSCDAYKIFESINSCEATEGGPDVNLQVYTEFKGQLEKSFRLFRSKISPDFPIESIEWLTEDKVIRTISKKDNCMYLRVRCLIRDISKFTPIIKGHAGFDKKFDQCHTQWGHGIIAG